MEEFSTGAVRSSDAAGEDYWLITPIGLRRLAKMYVLENELLTIPQYIETFYDSINSYFSGCRANPYLEQAAYSLSQIIFIESKNIYGYVQGLGYFNIPPIVIKELAITYAEGRIKYTAYNCELGFPIHDLLNHSLRHMIEYRLGVIEDRHLPHALWNVLMAMHSEEKWPTLNEPYLREYDCELTESIRKRIDEEIKAKLIDQTGDSGESRGSKRRRTSHARRAAK